MDQCVEMTPCPEGVDLRVFLKKLRDFMGKGIKNSHLHHLFSETLNQCCVLEGTRHKEFCGSCHFLGGLSVEDACNNGLVSGKDDLSTFGITGNMSNASA